MKLFQFGLCSLWLLHSSITFAQTEICNELDDDGDGAVDEDFDRDADGYFDCPGPLWDCDDRNEKRYPGAIPRCGGLDDDCDGLIDEGCACRDETIRACPGGIQECYEGAWGTCLLAEPHSPDEEPDASEEVVRAPDGGAARDLRDTEGMDEPVAASGCATAAVHPGGITLWCFAMLLHDARRRRRHIGSERDGSIGIGRAT